MESYEYEMPKNFEDEEIDEDTAFTEADNARYGEFFANFAQRARKAAKGMPGGLCLR